MLLHGFRNNEVADTTTDYDERGVFPKTQIAD
jgi:hypothetical protein